MRALSLIAAALCLLATTAGAASQPAKAGKLVISGPVVRASLGHTPTTAAYLTISNGGDAPDRLMSASCACADKIEAHVMQEMKGMMMMGDDGPVVIPAHGAVTFQPGGRHLMLTGLKQKLVDGGRQKITLVFERAGQVKVSFDVRDKIEASPAH